MNAQQQSVPANAECMTSAVSVVAHRSFLAFFLLLPFTYALQVVFGAPEIATVTYFFLVVALGALLLDAYRTGRVAIVQVSLKHFLPLCFAFLFMHHLLSVAITLPTGNAQLGVRALLLFTLPLLLFWAVQLKRQERLAVVLPLVAIGGVFVCSEMLYETFSLRILDTSTAFQLLNREYVISRIGHDLTQLWRVGYRPPGLLEHVHAVTIFAALAALAHMVLFCRDGRWYWLAGLTLCAGALLVHGTRVPVAAFMLAFLVLGAIFSRTETDSVVRRRGLIVTVLLVGLVLFVLFVDPFGTAKAYYWPALTRGDLQVSGRTTVQMITEDSMQQTADSVLGRFLQGQDVELSALLFGNGIVGSLRGDVGFNDDLFLFAVLAQYGVPGFLVFLGLWCYAIYKAIQALLKQREIDVQARSLLYFATAVLVVLGLSLSHSSVLQRKAIYPFFPIAAGIVWRYRCPPRGRLARVDGHVRSEGAYE